MKLDTEQIHRHLRFSFFPLLLKVAEEVVNEFHLDSVTIKFRYSVKPIKTKSGSIQKDRGLNPNYKINIPITIAGYVPDPEGKYFEIVNTVKTMLSIVPKFQTREEYIDSLSHELAHMRYFNHSKDHKRLTRKITHFIESEIHSQKIDRREIQWVGKKKSIKRKVIRKKLEVTKVNPKELEKLDVQRMEQRL